MLVLCRALRDLTLGLLAADLEVHVHCRLGSDQRTEDPPWSLGDVHARSVDTFGPDV